MNINISKLVVKLLRESADKIEDGSCNLTLEEQADIINTISHRALSKGEACAFLNLSRSRFDDLVRLGKIPRGVKRRWHNDLVWYEDELRSVIRH